MLAYISRLPPLSEENRNRGPYALVLAPTRELAQQIESETNKFTKLLGYKCVSIVGGRAIEEQQFNMRDGAEIIIATPGRLKDCLERSVLCVCPSNVAGADESQGAGTVHVRRDGRGGPNGLARIRGRDQLHPRRAAG